VAAPDEQPCRPERLGQLLLETRGLATRQPLQVQRRAGQHFEASLQDAKFRELAPRPRTIGYSAHSEREAAAAETDGADFILAGSIYATRTHPGHEAGGIPLLERMVATCSIPVLAIGGVTAGRVPELLRTGAYGVAVIRAVWDAADPVKAAEQLGRALES
jgi:thiamine-phosphate diphosphorylase